MLSELDIEDVSGGRSAFWISVYSGLAVEGAKATWGYASSFNWGSGFGGSSGRDGVQVAYIAA